MDWTVELHRDDGGDAKMIDLPNFEAVLACIKEHKEKGFLGTLGVHAQVQPTDEETRCGDSRWRNANVG